MEGCGKGGNGILNVVQGKTGMEGRGGQTSSFDQKLNSHSGTAMQSSACGKHPVVYCTQLYRTALHLEEGGLGTGAERRGSGEGGRMRGIQWSL